MMVMLKENDGYVKREKDTSAILSFPSAICRVNMKMMLCLQRIQAKIQGSVFLLNSNTRKKMIPLVGVFL